MMRRQGKHLRHATDHFLLLLESLNASCPSHSDGQRAEEASGSDTLNLNYDVRARGTPMEGSRVAAHATLEHTIERIRASVHPESPAANIDRPVRLEAVTPHAQVLGSSFGREVRIALTFNLCAHARLTV